MSGAAKRVIQSHHLVTDADASISFTANLSHIGFLDNYTFEFIFTGTPSATILIQESVSGTAWTDIFTVTETGGSPSPITFERNQSGGRYVQFVYTATGGSGTFNAYIQAKEI